MCNLGVFQIYFNELTKSKCFVKDEFLILNKPCTPFFENKIIYDLHQKKEHLKYDFFGVLSWKTLQTSLLSVQTKKRISFEVIHEVCEKHNPELLAIQRLNNTPRTLASFFLRVKNFANTLQKLLDASNIEFDVKNTRVNCYPIRNQIIYNSQIFDKYVNNYLAKCVQTIEKNSEIKTLVMQNFGYLQSEIRIKQNPDLWKEIGVNYYPYLPFLLETLPIIFIQKEKIKTLEI